MTSFRPGRAAILVPAVALLAGCTTAHPPAVKPVVAPLLSPGGAATYQGPGIVTSALTFVRGLASVEHGEGLVVAGIRERPRPEWGDLYRGSNALPTSLVIRALDGQEKRWRPPGAPSMVAGYPTESGIVVIQRTPRRAAECAPLITNECESWALLLLDVASGTTRQLLAGDHAVPVELTPDLLVQASAVVLTEPLTGGGARLVSINLATGNVRRVATLPLGSADLSGSVTGTLFAVSTDFATRDELASVDMARGRVTRLGRAPNATAGPRALVWVEPADADAATRIRVRPFGAHSATAFGIPGVDTYYVRWVTPTALLAVSNLGLDLYTKALSAHPVRTPLGPRDWNFVPEVGVYAGGGFMSFGLVSPDLDSVVHFFVVHL